MERWAPRRDDVLAELADEILHNYATGRTLVAVDGRAGSGQAGFADALVAALNAAGTVAARVPIAAFATGDEDSFRSGFDDEEFRRVVVQPFRSGDGALPGLRDRLAEPGFPGTVPEDAVLIVDGVLLHRPEIAGAWKYSLWLEVPQDLADERLAEAGESPEAIERARTAQSHYRSRLDPTAQATALIDNSDPQHPRRIFADSC